MSRLASAFAGLQEVPKRPDTQAPKSPGTQEPKKLSAQAPKSPSAEAPALPLQGTAKSKHPDFSAVKVYLRTKTRTAAERKWEDEDGGDFSDLVEKLLQKYLSA